MVPTEGLPGIAPPAGREGARENRRAAFWAGLPSTSFPGYLHEIPRSCAGTLKRDRYGSPRRGGSSLPGPSPGDFLHGPVHGMTPAKGIIRAGTPGRPYQGISPALPPLTRAGEEREARAGWGREESGVFMRCRQNAHSGPAPRPRPSRALTTRTPAPARESCGRANTVLFDGEGVPSPAPPRVIATTVRRMG